MVAPITIAIDGPAASGKGTLARSLAKHFSLAYLDTGALYRIVGLEVLRLNLEITDVPAITKIAEQMDFDFRPVVVGEETTFHGFLNGEDIHERLLCQEAGSMASQVAAIPEVRLALRDFQISFVKKHQNNKGVILDGRDIGTVICPNAKVKFFLVADAFVRAQRRHKQLIEDGKPSTGVEMLHQEILERDARDQNRTTDPLRPTDDAILLDTTTVGAEATFKKAMAHIHSVLAG